MKNQQLSLTQIARELSISQATLSNWQARYGDFPEPVATVGRRRLYSLQDVREFIERRGLNLAVSTSISRVKEANLVRQSFDLLRAWRAIGIDVQLIVGTLAVLATETPNLLTENPTALQLQKASQDKDLTLGLSQLVLIPTDIAQALMDEWVQVSGELDRVRLAKSLRASLENLGVRGLGAEHVTASGIAELIRTITPGLEILDLCSGTGRLLHEYRNHVRRMVGQEINEEVAVLSRLLARIEGLTIEIHHEDALHICHEDWMSGFDAVIADPPMGQYLREGQINPQDRRWISLDSARRTTGDDFWIQSALAYLRPSDSDTRFRAVLVLRASWFFDGPSRAMRAALVKLGYVEAVISLGAGLHPGTGIAVNLLVLRKTSRQAGHVRMIDAREAGKIARRTRELSAHDIRSIAAVLEGETLTSHEDSPIKVYDVPIGEVLNNDAVLDVQRYIPDPNTSITLETAIERFEKSVKEFQSSMNVLARALIDVDSSRAAELAHDLSQTPVRLIRLDEVATDNSPLIVLAKSRRQGFDWTPDDVRRDDVVVSALGSSVGRVLSGSEFLDRRETWSKIWILRVQSPSLFPPYLLAWAKHGGLEMQLKRLIAGSTVKTIASRDFEKVTVPLIDLELQRSVAIWGNVIDTFTSAATIWSIDRDKHLAALTSLSAVVFSSLNRES
jgi:hypothetical protein